MRSALLAGAVAVASLAGVATAMVPETVGIAAGSATFSGGTVVTTLPSYGARGSDVVDYRHGEVLRIAVPLRNTGRLPLTVTSVDLGGEPLSLLTLTGVRRPLSLGAGETRIVTVEAVLGNCRYYHEREVSTFEAVRVGVEVLGRSAERRVALTRPLLVHSPMIVGCPDRKLNRQADNRTG